MKSLYRVLIAMPALFLFLFATVAFAADHSETDGLFPLDTHGAIGVNHFVEVTNSYFDVFSKASPPALVKSVALATFFNSTAETLFDPRVVFDKTWQRWIVTAKAFPESTTVQRLCIGISKTSNPTGAFFMYNLDVEIIVEPPLLANGAMGMQAIQWLREALD